jgi:ABC-type transport system involved in cytochrome c biogenesis permease component
VVIFGVSAVDALTARAPLLLLGALLAGAVVMCPLAAGAALRAGSG